MTLKCLCQVVLFAIVAVAVAGCSRKTTLSPYPTIVNPVVFQDAFDAHEDFRAFGGSKYDALSIVSDTTHGGSAAAIRVTVPSVGDPSGAYAGGAFTTNRARDFSSFNAVSFWVRANRPVVLDECGLGNDNSGTSKLVASRTKVPVTTSWTQVLLPIPNPAKLTNESGMFYFSEGPQSGVGLTLWLDDITYVTTAAVQNPRPSLASQTIFAIVPGSPSLNAATKTVFSVNGVDQTVGHMAGYFDFASSDPAVATIKKGVVSTRGGGVTTLTATLGSLPVAGSIVINATVPPPVAPPAPTLSAADVIPIFSDAYPNNRPVDKWSADWDNTAYSDLTIAGHPVKVYTNMYVAGIEYVNHPIDASAMTAFHMDVFVRAGTFLKVKVVDFGDDGVYSPGIDDSEATVTLNATSTPPLPIGSGTWVPIDIPMSAFTSTSLNAQAHMAQLIFEGDTRVLFVDNIYFHK